MPVDISHDHMGVTKHVARFATPSLPPHRPRRRGAKKHGAMQRGMRRAAGLPVSEQESDHAPHLHSAISAAGVRAAALDAGTAEDDDEWEDMDNGLCGAHPFLKGVGRMRLPSRSLHGIEGALFGPGAKTVIAAKVGGKFRIRCVVCLSLSVFGTFSFSCTVDGPKGPISGTLARHSTNNIHGNYYASIEYYPLGSGCACAWGYDARTNQPLSNVPVPVNASRLEAGLSWRQRLMGCSAGRKTTTKAREAVFVEFQPSATGGKNDLEEICKYEQGNGNDG
ncbi:hypothetical protein B0H14DRAFT_3171240 [Mycena olivaceomarginata]|nr:hypothetical protein B0H14DRAFT_3171240 [Mycena olivaceomarginata]